MRPDLDRRVTQPSRLSPRHYAGQPRPLPSRPPRTRSTLSLHDALPIYPSVDDAGMLRAAALALRGLLDELGLPSWVKTSGSKGFHIVVPLDGKSGFGEVARFAQAAGSMLISRDPEHLTQEFSKADRGGRILIDTGRNGYSATFAAV